VGFRPESTRGLEEENKVILSGAQRKRNSVEFTQEERALGLESPSLSTERQLGRGAKEMRNRQGDDAKRKLGG